MLEGFAALAMTVEVVLHLLRGCGGLGATEDQKTPGNRGGWRIRVDRLREQCLTSTLILTFPFPLSMEFPMSRILGVFALVLSLLVGSSAWAEAPAVTAVQEKLAIARGTLMSMMNPSDSADFDTRVARLKEVSDEIDSLTANNPEFKEFRDSWAPFRTTRDTEILPLIKAKKHAEAKAIATGVQQERLQKMTIALSTLKK